MKPTEIRETAAAMLPDSCIGTQRGGGGARERASTADTFGEANTVVFLSFVNSARGPKCVLARAPLCAENCFRGHWETNTNKSLIKYTLGQLLHQKGSRHSYNTIEVKNAAEKNFA